MLKLNKTHYKYIGLALLCFFLLPILPLIIGIYFAIKIFRSNPNKKRGLGLAALTVIASFFVTGAVVNAWPDSLKSKPKPTSAPEVKTVEPTKQAEVTTAPQITNLPTVVPKPTEEPNNRTKATIVKVVDGDTMDFNINGKIERVRVIGINTPETVDPRKSVECFGQEASHHAKLYFEDDKEVELEADPTQGDRDKYGRLLRYIFTNDGIVDYGKVTIALGYAYEYTYNIPYKYQAIYKQAQREAEAGKKGLWADNACVATPTTKPVVYPTTPPVSGGGACKYSCSGPDRDCSDFSTHSEAVTFFNCCGFTATNDPMKLDSVGVGDGVPCESLP